MFVFDFSFEISQRFRSSWGELHTAQVFVVDFSFVIFFVDSLFVDLLFVGPGPKRALTLTTQALLEMGISGLWEAAGGPGAQKEPKCVSLLLFFVLEILLEGFLMICVGIQGTKTEVRGYQPLF